MDLLESWLSQVEIEYFLALMATLPLGQDLPSSAAAQLREIPAKLTLANAQVRREGNNGNVGEGRVKKPWKIDENPAKKM